MSTQSDLAKAVLAAVRECGVREFVVCAGARNAALVKAIQSLPDIQVYSFFEERSAGFFALGRSLAEERPVAVITTSGTAAAELLPACIEADYQRVGLVWITADRPSRYRGHGAPQAILQPGLFSHYVERTYDIEGEFDGGIDWSRQRPIHINVCFEDPRGAK